MLVLGRKEGERIMIGDDVEIVVIKVRGDRVRLGFKAAPHVAIRRDELEPRSAPVLHGADSAVGVATCPH